MIDIEKYFKKASLSPAIVQEEGTNEVLMLAYMNRESMKKRLKPDILGFGHVQGRNFGIRAQLRVIFKKLCQSTVIAMMIRFWLRLYKRVRLATRAITLAF